MQKLTGFQGLSYSVRLSSRRLVLTSAFSRYLIFFVCKFTCFLLNEAHLLSQLVVLGVP